MAVSGRDSTDQRRGLTDPGFLRVLPSLAARERLTSDDVEFLIQFIHPDKLLGLAELPPPPDHASLAALFDTTLDVYESVHEKFANRAQLAAQDLLQDLRFGRAIDALPFRSGDLVVAAGDSITDDLQSWAELLRHLLALRRPSDEIQVINAGVSGETTADLLSRCIGITRADPDWIITLIGTNDVQRYGNPPVAVRVSPSETEKNLVAVRQLCQAQSSARLVWMTPPPVLEERIVADRLLGAAQVIWRNEDLATVADQVYGLGSPTVDLRRAFGDPISSDLLLEDGLHPSLAGHQRIVGVLVDALSRVDR